MPSKQRFVLGVDLDGVVADFYGALRPIAASWLGVPVESLTENVTYGLPEWKLHRVGTYEDLHRWAVTQHNLFQAVEPIHGAGPALRRLSTKDIRIRIITHRLFIKFAHRLAVEQTTAWLEKHGIPYWDLCFMADKGAVGADLYIDDTPKNVLALRAAKHPTIVFSNSTNSGIDGPRADDWEAAEAHVLAAVKTWKNVVKSSATSAPARPRSA
jgi:5'(3')-deoxyribonucleotidase